MTKRQILNALKEGAFDPKKDRLMAVIVDVGNYDYYVKRAIEALLDNDLNLALGLIAVAKCVQER